MSEVLMRLTSDHVKVKGGEYVQDLVRCSECKNRSKCHENVHQTSIGQGLVYVPISFCSAGERDE